MSLIEVAIEKLRTEGIVSTSKLGVRYITQSILGKYNKMISDNIYTPPTDLNPYKDVLQKSRKHSDISDHLPWLFTESIAVNPDTIVELGVRGGESTTALEPAAKICGSDLVSVDINEPTTESSYKQWNFVQADDVEFGEQFQEWCDEQGIDSNIDVLFIDTSHTYHHTVEEINTWFKYLEEESIVFFHDTNMSRIYKRRDGSYGIGWNNNRGVIRAIEEHLGCSLDETSRFVTIQEGYIIDHYPECSGLTILKKTESLDNEEI